jgi:undecaprenyl-diphosphatase
MHQSLHTFDKKVSTLVQLLPSWLHPIMVLASFIGQPLFMFFVGTGIAIAAFEKGRKSISAAFVLVFIAQFGNTILKMIFQRQRPDTLYVSNMIIKSYSFPSGHAFGAAVFYGLLAYLIFVYVPRPWNSVGALACGFLILLIGISRVYLGAHFPSDVVIGWLLGLISLMVIIKVLRI